MGWPPFYGHGGDELAYLQSSGGEIVPPEQIQALAALIGLSIPAEDLEALATALRDQLASVRSIQALHAEDVSPPGAFDPRWHD